MTAVPTPQEAPPEEQADDVLGERTRSRPPYVLLVPGLAWLALFFVVPMFALVSMSLQTGSLSEGYRVTWNWSAYSGAWAAYGKQFVRSFLYAGSATILALLIG